MLPTILNDTGDCCCQKCPRCNNCDCVPGGDGCICRGDGTGDSIESAITCDLVWSEKQANGRKKYYKVVSGSSQQNQPVVLPTASLTKRGVVQLTNDLSDREDLALTPKGAKVIKTALDKETAERTAKDTDLQNQINKEKTDRANADADLLNKINQEKTDRANADKTLSDKLDKEITDRKNGDTNLSNSITTINNKVTDAVNKANNAVTSVTSNGNATVTVKKADGTSSSFTINNVAHASSADSATNANHATNADNASHATTADSATKATKATNADHATVADRLSSGSELDTSSVLGAPNWSKYFTAQIGTSAPNSTSYTFTSNCLCILKYSTTITPQGKFNRTVKVDSITIYSINQNNQSQSPTSYDDKESYLFKKGDVLSIVNNLSDNTGGTMSITLSILPLG